MFKKVVSGLLAVVLASGVFSSCAKDGKGDADSDTSSMTEAEQNAQTVKDAIEGLRAFDDNYIITNVLSMPTGTDYYLEVKTSDGSYREYPYTDGAISAEEATDTTYSLYDWVTTDGEAYLVNPSYVETDSTTTYWISTPEQYATAVKEREICFLDTFFEAASDWTYDGSQTLDLGKGAAEVQMYRGTVTSDAVAAVLGVDTLPLYRGLKVQAEEKKDENMINLMDLYIEELGRALTFSDGKILVGIYNGAVRYVELEAGGLGAMMYYTKTVICQSDLVPRDLPDFSSVEEYYDTARELADYVAQYDNYNEAMQALYGNNGTNMGAFEYPAPDDIVDDFDDTSATE